ncbi:MAG: phenylalanine--tRNA ligase subunit alpha [Bacteroidia bacterium]|nr:MAG: phenylalanine--tRNA ligase subunit alpha [Bacteroidia bacterium]
MTEKIRELLQEAKAFQTESREEIESFRIKYLSKKNGILTELFKEFKHIPPEQKKEFGSLVNELKQTVTDKVHKLNNRLSQSNKEEEIPDLSLPVHAHTCSRHPISLVRNEIIEIFTRLGFSISEGPEIEDDKHVFEALNFPPEHPARDMQDTFFITQQPGILLRTHTSSVQARVMEAQKPPIRTISPGRVFRNEAISARSHCIFHQIEGLYIDKDVSFADLKQTLLYFAKEFFGQDTRIRLRPSYFPFTEPSAEMDVSCSLCEGKGCNVCKYTGWLEILGCGMVDPAVLEYSNICSKTYRGFAFGMGIERIVMLRYGITDIRLLFENDLRFLRQFH